MHIKFSCDGSQELQAPTRASQFFFPVIHAVEEIGLKHENGLILYHSISLASAMLPIVGAFENDLHKLSGCFHDGVERIGRYF